MLGVDCGWLDPNPFRFEASLHELCVSGVVFKVQNLERGIHSCYFFFTLPGGGSLITAQNTPNSLIASTN